MTATQRAESGAGPDWPNDIHRVLRKFDVRQITHVPDAGHTKLLHLCEDDPSMRVVTLTTEEEGVAQALGAWLGGQRAALLMQSSGVGNTINMLGLTRTCRFPFLAIVTMRGEWGEFNPWQVAMGQATRDVLRAMGVLVLDVTEREAVGETMLAASRLAFDSFNPVAVTLSQRLIGTKAFEE
jgi:sulfopyruvate decarboxylase alpha subunit